MNERTNERRYEQKGENYILLCINVGGIIRTKPKSRTANLVIRLPTSYYRNYLYSNWWDCLRYNLAKFAGVNRGSTERPNEPRYDKTNKMICAPSQRFRSAWAFAQSDQSSLSAWRKLGSLATHCAHSKDSDQTGQMPRLILSLRWAHMPFCWFCHEATQIWILLLPTLLCWIT